VRTCSSCGREHPDERDFCECGEYLRWDPTRIVQAVPAPPAATPPTPPSAGSHPPAAPRSSASQSPELVSLTLRLPDGQSGDDKGTVQVALEPGARALVRALVRNQSSVVDNYDLKVIGLPDGWWTIAPPTVYLVPFGAGGTYEQEVDVHIHPPHSPDAAAKTWPFEITARSRAHEIVIAAAPASVDIAPYSDVRTHLSPDRASGRRQASFALAVENHANAPAALELGAQDTDAECNFLFAQPQVTIAPGERAEVPLVVRPPRQIWVGRSRDRQFQANATGRTTQAAVPPQTGTFRQRPWIPLQVAAAAPILAVIAALVLILLPKNVTVPDLTKIKDRQRVEMALFKAKLNPVPIVERQEGGGTAGQIVSQTPPAGAKAKRGTAVTIHVVQGTTVLTVPKIVGMKLQDAAAVLSDNGLQLGEVLPPPPDPQSKITGQIPAAGKVAHEKDAVMVVVVPAAQAGAGAKPGAGKVAMPAVAGLTVSAAAATLAKAGLVPVPKELYSDAKPGTLVKTSPPAGADLPKGTKVQLVVSVGSPQLIFDTPQGLQTATGSASTQLATFPGTTAGDESASWGPDGSHIAFRNGSDIRLVQPGKPSAVLLRRSGYHFHDPTFAPGHRVLALVRRADGDDADGDLCVSKVLSEKATLACITEPGFDVGRSVSWSPDGRSILIAGHDKGRPDLYGLVLYRSSVPFSSKAKDWGHGKLVTKTQTGQGVLAGAFSPDGKQLAAAANLDGGGFTLYLTKPDDFELTQAKQEANIAACLLAWRPDSAELAIVSNSGCANGLPSQVVRFDPAHPEHTTPVAPQGDHPAWQPLPPSRG
jgi:beta-lactam-binding protein with PASTA domain